MISVNKVCFNTSRRGCSIYGKQFNFALFFNLWENYKMIRLAETNAKRLQRTTKVISVNIGFSFK